MRWSEENIPSFIPSAKNGYSVEWEKLNKLFPVLEELRSVPQDPIYHQEGDVFTHTTMVVESLTRDVHWQNLPAIERAELWLGTLLHDIGKLKTTEVHPDGRITSYRHTIVGSRMTRECLWMHPKITVPFESRERIAAFVRHHGLPVWLLTKSNPIRKALLTSQEINMHQLYLLSVNDMKGRICEDLDDKLETIELFRIFCNEQGSLDEPFSFADDFTRYLYACGADRDPSYPAYDDTKMEVTLLSGLPASGKDTWIEQHGKGKEIISLDGIRKQMGVDPTDNQGKVIQAAKEKARECLRNEIPFIWNATNITRYLRVPLIQLFTQYHARVKLVYLECCYDELLDRNRNREDSVPEAALQKMIRKLEVPKPYEAHSVSYSVV